MITRQFSSGGVLFKRSRGQIFVALISRQGERVWCLPKGLVEKGEGPEEAALREVREETGLTGKILQKLGDISYRYSLKGNRAVFLKRVTFFLIRHTGGDTRDHDFEVDEAAWFPIREAAHRLTYAKERKIMEKARLSLQRTAKK